MDMLNASMLSVVAPYKKLRCLLNAIEMRIEVWRFIRAQASLKW